MNTVGNIELLSYNKVGFLCPNKIPATLVLKIYDWAIEKRDNGTCIISGFHSKIEKDVFHFLLSGAQPIILALARGLMKNYDPSIKNALQSKRLLIMTPFEDNIKRITKDTAYKRNELICEVADEIFIPYVSSDGLTKKIVSEIIQSGKMLKSF